MEQPNGVDRFLDWFRVTLENLNDEQKEELLKMLKMLRDHPSPIPTETK